MLKVVGGPEPVPNVVQYLEERLEEARRGEIIAVAMATVNHKRVSSFGLTYAGGVDLVQLLGSVTYLSNQVLNEVKGCERV